MFDFEKLFEDFKSIKVGVIGDVMLDTYWWGHVDRISPEAPVPVVALDKNEYRIGGAGNVALNLACLGAQVQVLSVIGNDQNGKVLTDLFLSNNIQTSYLVSSDARITTSKTRIISRNQQMMRLDAEITKDLSHEDEMLFLETVRRYLQNEKPSVVILEDYNKGVLTETIITEVIALCRHYGVITTVDPKKKNFFAYRGVDIFKPNLKEVKEGLNLLVDEITSDSLESIHFALQSRLGHRISFITLSEKGVYYCEDEKSRLIPSHVRNIADVSGAGDTVIAVASLVYATTRNVDLMAEIANLAGGLVCEEVGTMAIRKEQLLEETKELIKIQNLGKEN